MLMLGDSCISCYPHGAHSRHSSLPSHPVHLSPFCGCCSSIAGFLPLSYRRFVTRKALTYSGCTKDYKTPLQPDCRHLLKRSRAGSETWNFHSYINQPERHLSEPDRHLSNVYLHGRGCNRYSYASQVNMWQVPHAWG